MRRIGGIAVRDQRSPSLRRFVADAIDATFSAPNRPLIKSIRADGDWNPRKTKSSFGESRCTGVALLRDAKAESLHLGLRQSSDPPRGKAFPRTTFSSVHSETRGWTFKFRIQSYFSSGPRIT